MPEHMTPPAKAAKRTARSPLNEMDDDDEELEQAGELTVGLSVAAVANIVRCEIQRGMAPIEQQLTIVQTFFGDRLGQLEATMSNQGS